MPLVDSLDKILGIYVACVTEDTFLYKGKTYSPKMLRVDGERGALCEMTDPDAFTKAETLRKLRRLQEWSAHFGIRTKLSSVMEWVSTGPHKKPLLV